MILLLLHFVLLFIMFTTYDQKNGGDVEATDAPVPAVVAQPTEGSADWYANLQAIQSLMGLM
jgi:hypothetical protein